MQSAAHNRTLVTGFLAFEGFEVNPSALLAQSCGRDFELIEVAYRAVDQFIDFLDANRFDRLLMIGVAGKSSRMRIENVARNIVGERKDVRGLVAAGVIDPTGANQIRGSLWTAATFAETTERRRPSDDAGDYLCNYIYYRAMRKFDPAKKRIGFLHVPPIERMPLTVQQIELANILQAVE